MEYSGSDTVAPLDLQHATIEENWKEEGNYQAHELEASIQPRDASSLFEGAEPPYYHHHLYETYQGKYTNAFDPILHNGERITRDLNACSKKSNKKWWGLTWWEHMKASDVSCLVRERDIFNYDLENNEWLNLIL